MNAQEDNKNSFKSKDSKKVREFEINMYKKGFTVSSYIDNTGTSQEYFLFSEIQQIIYYTGIGVEVINNGGKRRVFYNDEEGISMKLFEEFHKNMTNWMENDGG